MAAWPALLLAVPAFNRGIRWCRRLPQRMPQVAWRLNLPVLFPVACCSSGIRTHANCRELPAYSMYMLMRARQRPPLDHTAAVTRACSLSGHTPHLNEHGHGCIPHTAPISLSFVCAGFPCRGARVRLGASTPRARVLCCTAGGTEGATDPTSKSVHYVARHLKSNLCYVRVAAVA